MKKSVKKQAKESYRCNLCMAENIFATKLGMIRHYIEFHPKGAANLYDALGTVGNPFADAGFEVLTRSVYAEHERANDYMTEAIHSNARYLGAKVELAQAERKLKIINLMTRGDINEAIQEFLKPVALVNANQVNQSLVRQPEKADAGNDQERIANDPKRT